MERQDQVHGALYSKLDPELRQIRLFTLLPGSFDDPIKGYLTQVLINDDLSYEALSYVWGDPSVTLPIFLRNEIDSTSHTEFMVTTNLESALRHLRLKTDARSLRIDAICINQSDVLERNHQVKNMKWVYSAASKVLAWLGKWTVYSHQGLKMLLKLMTTDECPEIFGSSQAQECLKDILNRNYWERIWVIQEISVAKRLFLLCGLVSVEIPTTGCLNRTTRNAQRFQKMEPLYERSVRVLFSRFLRILQLQEDMQFSRTRLLWELV